MNTPESVPTTHRLRLARTLLRILVLLPWLLLLLAGGYALVRFVPDEPVVHADPVEHFKYGSTGGERASGFPYWIWQALPTVCAEHLPGPGYASLGLIFEEGRDLPVGVSKRRHLGIDRVFLNCAACHAGLVRDTPAAPARLVVGMPAHRFDILAFQRFFFECAAGPTFSREFIVPEIERLSGGLGLVDRYLVYPVAIALMRERLLMLRARFGFVSAQAPWGPGRVDTFNAAKVLFNFPVERLPARERLGAADFPSIWNQRKRMQRDDGERMELHWDGNNTHTEERNKSAAFGTGTTPPTIDLAAISRVEAWLLDLAPPAWPLPVDKTLAARGAALYARYCADCHGASGSDFAGPKVGHVTPIADIATDPARLDSYTRDLAVNQATLYAGYPHRFRHFRKTWGYANMPLDGIWLRAPYLHNGSVPSLRDLLEPPAQRPTRFWRGYDVYDPDRVGFVTHGPEAERIGTVHDVGARGGSNRGHAFGTTLPAADKADLLEYLKTM